MRQASTSSMPHSSLTPLPQFPIIFARRALRALSTSRTARTCSMRTTSAGIYRLGVRGFDVTKRCAASGLPTAKITPATARPFARAWRASRSSSNASATSAS